MVAFPWPDSPIDQRFGPLVLVCLPLIAIPPFVHVAYVRWHF
jgi:hypothetical protein